MRAHKWVGTVELGKVDPKSQNSVIILWYGRDVVIRQPSWNSVGFKADATRTIAAGESQGIMAGKHLAPRAQGGRAGNYGPVVRTTTACEQAGADAAAARMVPGGWATAT